MTYAVSIEYTGATVNLAARAFLRRFLLPEIAIGASAIAAAAGLYVTEVGSPGVALACAGVGCLLILISGLIAWRYVQGARRKFRALGASQVEWTFSETVFGTKSALGTAEMPWSAVKRVWQFKDVWLLFFDGGGYSTLPTDELTPELRVFIRRHLKA